MNKTYVRYFVINIILLMVASGVIACNSNLSSTSTTANNNFRSDKYYLNVTLPETWAAVEGPEDIVSTGHMEGQVAFNSWGQDDFWAHEVLIEKTADHTTYRYSTQTVIEQIPKGGAYIVLVRIYPPGGDLPLPADEYITNDLSGLYEPHDWRSEDCGARFISFCKWGRFLELEVCCQPHASDATVAELNALLASWKFDEFPVGDILWAHTQAIKLLPEEVKPLEFAVNPASAKVRSGDRITEVEVRDKTVHFRYTYYWDTSSSHPDWLSDKFHWWDIDVLQDGRTMLIAEGGEALPLKSNAQPEKSVHYQYHGGADR